MSAKTSSKTRTRAWDLRPGDILHPIGFTITDVTVDRPGQYDRMVHITHNLGVEHLPINQFVYIQNVRETGLWD